jgi:Domain of unknown function (DUF4214)
MEPVDAACQNRAADRGLQSDRSIDAGSGTSPGKPSAQHGVLAMITRSIALAAALAFVPALETEAAVPGQFIAKMYTEALGRAPDPGGWQSAVGYYQQHGCDQTLLRLWGASVFTSAEYTALGYDNAAHVLLMYRAILNREPDAAGYHHWRSTLDNGSMTVSTLANAFFTSAEFGQLVDDICDGGTYSFDTLGNSVAIRIPTSGSGGYENLTAQQLQSIIDAAPSYSTVYLKQKSVVYLDRPIDLDRGITLATWGLPNPRRHGLMARLVRSGDFASAMVRINAADTNGSGAVRNLWIDGARRASSGFILPAINVEIFGGASALVHENFMGNSRGWSNVHSFGALDGRPCASNTVTNNVITAYSSGHFNQTWTDGLSLGCENTVARYNEIIDATDVGIVLFTAHPAVQRSTVEYNTVINAGNSAFGGLAFDPLSGRSGDPDFSGASLSNNTLWSAPDTHFIIGLSVGSRPWFVNGHIGTGGTANGNTTAGITTRFGAGIVISGMRNATVQSNVFTAAGIPQSWTLCPTGNVLASVSAGLASGSIQSYQNVTVNGCMSDYSPPQ